MPKVQPMSETTHVETRDSSSSRQIVLAASQGLAVRSAALVARGLRDLARDSNWLIKKIFTGHSPQLAISPAGEVCSVSPQVRHGSQTVALHDIELSVPTMALSVPGGPPTPRSDLASVSSAAFAWSANGRHLIASWAGWTSHLHLFDLQAKMLVGSFGKYQKAPHFLAWSSSNKYFSAATSGGKDAALRVWESSPAEMPFSSAPSQEIGSPASMEPQAYGEGFDEEGAFRGYGRLAFSPDEQTVAAVAEIQGDWADDSIFLAHPSCLQNHTLFQAQGHITDLSWSADSRHIVYCGSGQAYRLAGSTLEFDPLPFGAELCACHPHLPLCLFFSSWLKNSAKGRLFLVDLKELAVFDEYAAEGVVDMRWNLDGSKAFAVTENGMAYIYDPPLL